MPAVFVSGGVGVLCFLGVFFLGRVTSSISFVTLAGYVGIALVVCTIICLVLIFTHIWREYKCEREVAIAPQPTCGNGEYEEILDGMPLLKQHDQPMVTMPPIISHRIH
ncbi:MAG: hypothetical protein WAX80_00985 [Minisyncoccia bacterium]